MGRFASPGGWGDFWESSTQNAGSWLKRLAEYHCRALRLEGCLSSGVRMASGDFGTGCFGRFRALTTGCYRRPNRTQGRGESPTWRGKGTAGLAFSLLHWLR